MDFLTPTDLHVSDPRLCEQCARGTGLVTAVQEDELSHCSEGLITLGEVLDGIAEAIPPVSTKQHCSNQAFPMGASLQPCRIWLLQSPQPEAGRQHLVRDVLAVVREEVFSAGFDRDVEEAAIADLHHRLVHSTDYEIAALLVVSSEMCQRAPQTPTLAGQT